MNDWEQHFRDKSRRRSLTKRREGWAKIAVLLLLAASFAAAAYLLVNGTPQ